LIFNYWIKFMLTVAQLAQQLGAELIGDGTGIITGVGSIGEIGENQISYRQEGEGSVDEKLFIQLNSSKAGAVIVAHEIKELLKPQLVVENVDTALIDVMNLLAPKLKAPEPGISSSATIGQGVEISDSASIGPYVVISDGVRIGSGTVISSGCSIGENTSIGRNSRLDSNVVVHHNCSIGNHVIIQANTTIGSTGFGYAQIDGTHRLVPHIGGVVIEDFVEIGANSCVDRAKFGNTVIGAGTKIDNLVQIAHNVKIGKCCLIVSLTGVSGSCKLGDGVVLGGQVGLVDNISIGAGTMIGAKSGVMSDVDAGKKLLGIPAVDHRDGLRIMGLRKRLPEMSKQLKELNKKVKELEASKDDKK
jgi:UDP-3-O-[3-hydroxymyristoyl] glucosamine N-acyltransferase